MNNNKILADESHRRGNKILANGQNVWVVITKPESVSPLRHSE